MKRICRQHGISRWPSRKINKVNRSLSKLKRVIESVQGAEGAFGLNSLSTSPLPIAVGSLPEPSTPNKFSQPVSMSIRPSEPQMKVNELSASKELETNREAGMEDQLVGGRIHNLERVTNDKRGFTQEIGKEPKRTRTGSGSSEDSTNPTSHGSWHDSIPNESSHVKDIFITSNHDQGAVLRRSPESTLQPAINTPNQSTPFRMPEFVAAELQEPFGGMLVEDAGSSKDLRNLCPSVAEAILEDLVPEACGTNPPALDLSPKQSMGTPNKEVTPFAATKEMKTVTIKATYREDIIRFRVSLTCGIAELKEEVAKRLKLEVGTFDIKYLDDDHEWVLIACDADLQECMDVSRSSGSNIVRVLVHDITSNLGSSCESSGE
ncbi:hypothetical protein V8G54_028971 [Vigna mungo]|uniref:Uncharacterized protein n=1 Tax=Vigna mungo TaxID=3915 RepID=A0AAQ3RM67_VIGMU